MWAVEEWSGRHMHVFGICCERFYLMIMYIVDL